MSPELNIHWLLPSTFAQQFATGATALMGRGLSSTRFRQLSPFRRITR